ncbi:MAG: transcription elongation factor GreA [Anaerolineales bacterium]|nr:transcription elongation factor GreA [Anaerolineales bacterium]
MAEEREFFLTPDGAAKLKAELDELRGPRRVDLAKRLRFAIQQGDLTENADYIAAKEEQAFLEGRIQELEIILRDAIIVEQESSREIVEIGSTVLVAENGKEPETYQLVGIKEADPRQQKVSYESPIGKALQGKRVGDTAIAETPAGKRVLKILEIN